MANSQAWMFQVGPCGFSHVFYTRVAHHFWDRPTLHSRPTVLGAGQVMACHSFSIESCSWKDGPRSCTLSLSIIPPPPSFYRRFFYRASAAAKSGAPAPVTLTTMLRAMLLVPTCLLVSLGISKYILLNRPYNLPHRSRLQ